MDFLYDLYISLPFLILALAWISLTRVTRPIDRDADDSDN